MKKFQTLTLAVLLTSTLSLGTVGAHDNTGARMNSTTGTNNYGAYSTSTGTISSPAASPSDTLNQTNYGTSLNSYSNNLNAIRAYDTSNTGSDASNWGWLGLIGLIGLAGLRSRNHSEER
ncbi:WGxxGxxG family protein [Paenibacillus oryzisoli]|uniref:MYXO-CTERM domain-containing protein n=1 Tax=Paenibacillus oryzisoli TaxID=1850517 RepID=A0A198A057_9BACL|nr:WGxxGxxG family protein [Paenibacillus oryzisoli]OAS14839.1 hypothetical protein A8708_04890 [Paenibacillus oryzisoli]